MISVKTIGISWAWLMLLSFIAVVLGHFWQTSLLFIPLVMLIVFMKGQQIIDIFMELKFAPNSWRFLLIAYVFIIPAIISIIYLI